MIDSIIFGIILYGVVTYKKTKGIGTTYFGGNSGYVGYSMSKRAAAAREDGRYPKTDFKKEYGVSQNTLDVLTEIGIIENSEWHHTSKFGNRTVFYGWADADEDNYGASYADIYQDHKKEIDQLCKEYLSVPEVQWGTQEAYDDMMAHPDLYHIKGKKIDFYFEEDGMNAVRFWTEIVPERKRKLEDIEEKILTFFE